MAFDAASADKDYGARASGATGNAGLDALADAIAERVIARLQAKEESRLMTVREAARHLRISERAVRYKIAQREIAVARDGRIVRIDRRTLDQWVDLRQSRG